MRTRLTICTAKLILLAGAAMGDVLPIDVFSGDLHEPLNASGTTIVAHYPIFGGAGALDSWDGHTTYIHYLLSDTFNGDPVNPRTGSHILGFTQGPGVFHFDPPIRRFGAYFNNNSGTDGAVVQFFDAAGGSLGTKSAVTPAAGTAWVWNGWESDTAIGSISVLGNGIINGFLWFDDLEIGYTPEPSALLGLSLLGGVAVRRARSGRAAA